MHRNLLAALATLALASCHDDSSDNATSFDATVTDLIQNGTDDTSDPIEVEGTNFTFPTSETAFDDVLPPDTGPVVPQ